MHFLAIELREDLRLNLENLISKPYTFCQLDSSSSPIDEEGKLDDSLERYSLIFVDQDVVKSNDLFFELLNDTKIPYITTSVSEDKKLALNSIETGAEDHFSFEDVKSDRMVSQRVQHAIARAGAKADVLEQNQVIKSVLDDAGHGVLFANASGELTMFNRTAEEIIGIGKTYSAPDEWTEVYGIYGEDEKTKMLTADLPLVKVLGGANVVHEHVFVKNNKLETGNHILCSGRPFKGGGGVMIISDITADIRAKEKIETYAHYLEQSNMELTQFSYRTSHDLKGPLITIHGLSTAIAEDIDSEEYEEARSNAVKINGYVAKLGELISDILDLAKADLNITAKESISIEEILGEINQRLETMYSDSDVVFESNIDSSIVFHSSKTRITQVLENLISNSIKYCDKKKGSRYVKVSTYKKGDSLCISVEDNGIGIPKEFEENLFQMFQRFHPNVAYGSGLGMYIVKKHIDRMDASIDLDSSELGSTFEIVFN